MTFASSDNYMINIAKVGYFERNGVSLHKNIYKQNTTCRYY